MIRIATYSLALALTASITGCLTEDTEQKPDPTVTVEPTGDEVSFSSIDRSTLPDEVNQFIDDHTPMGKLDLPRQGGACETVYDTATDHSLYVIVYGCTECSWTMPLANGGTQYNTCDFCGIHGSWCY